MVSSRFFDQSFKNVWNYGLIFHTLIVYISIVMETSHNQRGFHYRLNIIHHHRVKPNHNFGQFTIFRSIFKRCVELWFDIPCIDCSHINSNENLLYIDWILFIIIVQNHNFGRFTIFRSILKNVWNYALIFHTFNVINFLAWHAQRNL